MNYEFPKIRNIDDVLPHIEGFDEIVVAKKEDYTVVNYIVTKPNTFDIDPDNPLPGSIRRECRGLIFDTATGALVSRPFHKFFNIGEREETMPNNLNFSQNHTIYEKMDGSMVRPFFTQGAVRLGTRMGVTHVSMQAEEWYAAQEKRYHNLVAFYLHHGYTPLFEWVSPDNNIVVKYDEPRLVLLNLRDNYTGKYLDPESCPKDVFECVPMRPSVMGSVTSYIASTRAEEGCEGDIITWPNGHMVKLKNEWYVRIHKVKDKIRTERHIIALSLAGEIDDIKPNLDKADFEAVKEVEKTFWKHFDNKVASSTEICQAVIKLYNGDRKKIALEYVPFLRGNKMLPGLIFGVLDGKSVYDMVLAKVNASLGSGTKYDALMEWLQNEKATE